jgi:hypothetical protein
VYTQKIAMATRQYQGKPSPQGVAAALGGEGEIATAMFFVQLSAIFETLS